jgi:hypothetical protein
MLIRQAAKNDSPMTNEGIVKRRSKLRFIGYAFSRQSSKPVVFHCEKCFRWVILSLTGLLLSNGHPGHFCSIRALDNPVKAGPRALRLELGLAASGDQRWGGLHAFAVALHDAVIARAKAAPKSRSWHFGNLRNTILHPEHIPPTSVHPCYFTKR